MIQFLPLLLLIAVIAFVWWKIRKLRRPRVAPPAPLRGGFSTMVVGVSYANEDGMQRQDYINHLARPGTPIVLKREKNNRRDSNAVSVWLVATSRIGLSAEVQIGYLSRETAEEMAPLLDRGDRFIAAVEEVYPGEDDIPSGIAIRIVKS